ncbi:MAG: phytanoyl-CoA dioxygenase family protein [Candidatus Glassbacteria bacterium]|nr:phytanoyl-CoA dioxygenase family protein [Candidatus Glassbacteria bacterium]
MSAENGHVEYVKIGGMAGNMFPRADTAGERKKFELSGGLVDTYRERGFVGPVRVFDQEQVEVLLESLEKMVSPGFPRVDELIAKDHSAGLTFDRFMTYFQGAWMVDEGFHDAVFNPGITVPASQLMDTPRVRFWHDQMFYKPANHGGVVAWHQDYSYWTCTEPMGHLTVFIALDETTLENGCLHLVPGSHRWPLLPMTRLFGGDDCMERIKEALSPEQLDQFKPEPLPLEAGEASFHHPLTVHGSYSNRTDKPRRALVLNYMLPDTRSASDEALMPGSEPVPKGEIVGGDWFPIVIER